MRRRENCSPASGRTRRARPLPGWQSQPVEKSLLLVPLQQPSSVETQVPWEVSMTRATVSPPVFSTSSPAPSQRATASSDSRLVSNCFQTIRIFNRHRHRHHRQDRPHHLPAGLMNLATLRHRALPRGRAKCQRFNARGRSSNASSTRRLANRGTPTVLPATTMTTRSARV